MSRISTLIQRLRAVALYCWKGVWRDPSTSMRVRIIKTLNLCVHTFIDSSLQMRAASLVYSSLLAIVPAFALLMAIGRGFNLQNLLTEELYRFFPAQREVIGAAMGFVDRYLQEASQGIIVGIGIVFLLWTIISLLSDIELAFNRMWGITQGRSFYRKLTDYTAICIMVPVLMICSAGINIFMATAMNSVLGDTFLSPLTGMVLDCAPFVLACLAFTIMFIIMPNTRVRFKYAAISGVICGVAFQLIQTLFIGGQIYVAKYNAIYGSFAFLPLLLIWLQISWMLLLFGCTLTFSLQNIFHFTFTEESGKIAPDYRRQIAVVTMALIARRFRQGGTPLTLSELSVTYGLPIRLARETCGTLQSAGLIFTVEIGEEEKGFTPAVELDKFTLGTLIGKIDAEGESAFIPGFSERYSKVISLCEQAERGAVDATSQVLVADILLDNASDGDKPDQEAK